MGPEIISLKGGFPFLPGPLERSFTVIASINSLCITEQKLFWAEKDSFLGKIYFLSNTSLWAASKSTKNYNKPDLPRRI